MASRPPMKGFFEKLKRQVRGKPIVVAAQRKGGGGETLAERDTFVSGILKGRSFWTS